MPDRRQLLSSAAALAAALALIGPRPARANINVTLTAHYQVVRFIDDDSVLLLNGKISQVVRRGETFLGFTLMDIVPGDFVVVEDFTAVGGDMLIVDTGGVRWRLGKTAEASTAGSGATFLGDTADEVRAASSDLLGRDILVHGGDPIYEAVAAALPPIGNVVDGVWNFAGTPQGKVVFAYGGRTASFDPVSLQPSMDGVRQAGKVLDGLVGGYLPCLRFVYPEGNGAWTELVSFAPLAGAVSARHRVCRIESGKLVSSHYVDANGAEAGGFYADLAAMKAGWDKSLAAAMQIDVPDQRLADMARHGLVRAMIGGTQGTAEAFGAWGLAPAVAHVAGTDARPTLLSMPLDAAGEIAGNLIAVRGYDLIAADRIDEALLLTYAAMAHLCTRGGWMAVGTRQPFSGDASSYSSASQLAVPLLVRWLLAFEYAQNETLWLGKGMPQTWLGDTKLVFIDDIPTRWGPVSFATDSRIDKERRIAAKIVFPEGGIAAATKFRLRTAKPIRAVTVNDKSWKQFDPEFGDIGLPAGMGGTVILEARY